MADIDTGILRPDIIQLLIQAEMEQPSLNPVRNIPRRFEKVFIGENKDIAVGAVDIFRHLFVGLDYFKEHTKQLCGSEEQPGRS